MAKEFILILALIALMFFVVMYYIKELSKTQNDVEFNSTFSLKALTDGVADVFAETQKENLMELNLSRFDLAARKRKRRELKSNLKTAAFGDANAKKFIISFIVDIIQGKRFGLTEENIDKVISFNHTSSLSPRVRADIVFYIYHKLYGDNGFANFMLDNNFHQEKEWTEKEFLEGKLPYEITEEDMKNAFEKIIASYPLSFEDKLAIVARRIFADYKGFGAADWLFEFAIDEIEGGVNGVAKGAYEIKKSMMTKDFEYSFESIWIVFKGNNIKLSCLSFGTQDELVRVCKNIYKYQAPYALSRSKGHVTGTMKDGSRVSVVRPPEGSSWAFWVRKFDSTPSVALSELFKQENAVIPITYLKWLMKASESVAITGAMGTGKSTTLKGVVGHCPAKKNIRVYEISPELNLQFTYPKRNIFNFSTTETVTMQQQYDFGKKTTSNINIVGESASAEMGVIVIQSATVGSDQALFTHHAKTTNDLILSLRDNLTSAGGYSSEKVAEEVVAKCIGFDVHLARNKNERYIERITEIIPIKDRTYPYDRNGKVMTEEDTIEFYKRSTDRRTFITRDIMVYKNGKYIFLNPISDEKILEMRSKLSESEEALFISDMNTLRSFKANA